MNSLSILLFACIVVILLIFYKYRIDMRKNLLEMTIDRDSYRNRTWNLTKNMGKNEEDIEKQVSSASSIPYINLKKKIKELKNDLKETDFSNENNIKNDIILALENIESYGESND